MFISNRHVYMLLEGLCQSVTLHVFVRLSPAVNLTPSPLQHAHELAWRSVNMCSDCGWRQHTDSRAAAAFCVHSPMYDPITVFGGEHTPMEGHRAKRALSPSTLNQWLSPPNALKQTAAYMQLLDRGKQSDILVAGVDTPATDTCVPGGGAECRWSWINLPPRHLRGLRSIKAIKT